MEAAVTAALDEIERQLDWRVQHCRLAVAQPMAEEAVALQGEVLDEALLAWVAGQLAARFPGRQLDLAGVGVLSRPGTPPLTITTNLAGLHRGPARTSEQLTELLNGEPVTPLRAEAGWRYVQRADGYLGWLHERYAATWPAVPPTHIVCRAVTLLHSAPAGDAPLVGRVLAGTRVALDEDPAGAWTRLTLAGGQSGWVAAAALRPLAQLPADEAGRRAQIARDAPQFMGVPYRWGGCTALGIDCSGLAQLLHRLVGVTLPRDADMQFDAPAGTPIEPPFRPGDLLFFGSAQGHRTISHVGISLGGWAMIHASGPRNGVYVDDVQQADWLRQTFVGARTFLAAPRPGA